MIMAKPTKIILRWNILPGSESEYFEFMVSEFIPGIRRLGVVDPGVWYTAYGSTEQILVTGITETEEQMRYLLNSRDWTRLKKRLNELVDDFNQKVIPATGGFQL
jgi:hypothetical protein